MGRHPQRAAARRRAALARHRAGVPGEFRLLLLLLLCMVVCLPAHSPASLPSTRLSCCCLGLTVEAPHPCCLQDVLRTVPERNPAGRLEDLSGERPGGS